MSASDTSACGPSMASSQGEHQQVAGIRTDAGTQGTLTGIWTSLVPKSSPFYLRVLYLEGRDSETERKRKIST